MIIMAVILLVLVLLALLPVGVIVQYDDGQLQLQLGIGHLRITVYPPKEVSDWKRLKKQAKQRKKKQKRKAKKQEQSAEQKPKKKLSLAQLKPMIGLALDVVKSLPRKLLIRDLTVHATFGGSDAAQTAINYGRAWAAIGAVTPVLENTFRIQKRDVDARLDYAAESVKLFLRMDIRMRIGTGVRLILTAGIQFIRILLKNKKKAVQTNESSSL